MILGHHTEKITNLWNSVNRKAFLIEHNFSEGYIKSITRGIKKNYDHRVAELTKDLVTFRRISKPNYQFLKP